MLFENRQVVCINCAVYDGCTIDVKKGKNNMLDVILKIFKFLFDLYNAIPDDLKKEFKEKAADGFEAKFRDFYRKTSGA